MPRHARIAPAGFVYHVMNRTAGRFRMLRRDGDFEAFERIMIEAHDREPLPILSYCLMGNHWHFAVRPEEAGHWPNSNAAYAVNNPTATRPGCKRSSSN